MKIIYCVPSTYNSGGMERILSVKASYLADIMGYDVSIITTVQNDRTPFFKFSSKIRTYDLDINYRNPNSPKWKNIISAPYLRYKHKQKLSALLKELKPDIVISLFQDDASVLPEMNDGSIKLIESHFSKYYRQTLNNKGIRKYINKIRDIRDNNIIKKYSKFICLTHEDKQDWPNKDNIEVIYNPVTLNRKSQISASEKIDKGIKNILAVGRICYIKGFTRLVEIWKHVEPKHPDWTLTIIGSQDDINYVNQVKDLIKKYNLKNIKIKSPTLKIEDEFDSANFLVMTSFSEGLPLTLIESNTMGLPIISYDFKCGPKDIIKDGYNGFLISNGNVEEFVNKMEILMTNPTLLKDMSKNALDESLKYALVPIMKKWTDLFLRVQKEH